MTRSVIYATIDNKLYRVSGYFMELVDRPRLACRIYVTPKYRLRRLMQANDRQRKLWGIAG